MLTGALGAIVVCAMLAKRLALPYPIVFVLAGSALAFVPNVPPVKVDPQLIFLIVLPPLLFNGGWYTDWKLFRANARSITLLAVGLVLATTFAVAAAAHALGFAWAAAFVLGAIVSPPDAVAASAIFERFSIPRRIVAILEGEGLVNDGSALVIYRFAVAAAVTGTFSPLHAAGAFVVVAVGGIAAGIVAGVALEFATRLMARFELSDSLIDNLAFLFIPYAAYLLAESVHVSGVLATVAAGVYMGRRSAIIYGPDTRLVGRSVWMLINYLLNGFVFLLIGLQLRQIVESPTFSPREITIGLIVSLVAILTRIAWVFPATWLPRFLSRRTRAREPLPVNRNVAIVAWTGLRGIVSLAAALALPYSDATGGPFGQRDLIVFVTFCVIVVTLVFQGLSLIPLLSLLKIKGDESIEEREVEVRVHALRAGLDRLTKLESREHTRRMGSDFADQGGVRTSHRSSRGTYRGPPGVDRERIRS